MHVADSLNALTNLETLNPCDIKNLVHDLFECTDFLARN